MGVMGGGGGWWREDKNLVNGGIFLVCVRVGGNEQIFFLVGGLPPIPAVRKILVINTLHTCSMGHGFEPLAFLKSHTSFAKLL